MSRLQAQAHPMGSGSTLPVDRLVLVLSSLASSEPCLLSQELGSRPEASVGGSVWMWHQDGCRRVPFSSPSLTGLGIAEVTWL